MFLCTHTKKYPSHGNSLEKNGEAKVEEEKSSPPETPPPFYWLQGVEDMAVWVMLPKDIHKKEIKVSLKPSQMSIKIKNETVLDGKLWGVIDSDSMTWTIDTKKNKLEVTFCKANDNRNSGMIWQRFLADKELTDGEEVMHADMVEKIHQELSHLTTNDPNANSIKENSHVYNNQELESCDDNSTINRYITGAPYVVRPARPRSYLDFEKYKATVAARRHYRGLTRLERPRRAGGAPVEYYAN